MSTSGERLAEEVERLGGISTVAKMLSTARNTLYNWIEKGNVPLNKLEELASLGADSVYVLTGQRGCNGGKTMTPRESAVLADFRSASPEGQEAVEKTLKVVAQRPESKSKAGKAA